MAAVEIICDTSAGRVASFEGLSRDALDNTTLDAQPGLNRFMGWYTGALRPRLSS